MTLLKDFSKFLQFVYIYIKIAHSLPVKKKNHCEQFYTPNKLGK